MLETEAALSALSLGVRYFPWVGILEENSSVAFRISKPPW